MIRGWLAAALAASAFAAHAETWHLQVDNDLFFGTDRWYSSGVRIGQVRGSESLIREGELSQRRISDSDPLIEFGILHEIYTADAKHWAPGTSDRIPVGRLLAFGARHDREGGTLQTMELAAGVRGPAALGRQMTEALHRGFAAASIDWSRELENRFDAQAAFVRSSAVGASGVKAHYGLVAGNQIAFGHAGIEYRAGANSATSSGMLRFASTPPLADAASGWNAYGGASVRLVARNVFIGRNYSPYGPGLSRRKAVGRFVAGFAWSQPWGSVDIALAQETHEFVGQAEPHRFGSIAVRLAF